MNLRFYADTHIAKQITIQLQQKGVDIVRCEDVGLAEADDEVHLEYATREDRVLITFDQGFRARAFNWLADGKSHAGIFLLNQRLQGSAGIGQIVTECQFYAEALEGGAITIDEIRNNVIAID